MLVRGVLTRTAAAMPLQKVTGLALKRTVPGQLGYGTLIVDCPGGRCSVRSDTCPTRNNCIWRYPTCWGGRNLDETAYPADGGEG